MGSFVCGKPHVVLVPYPSQGHITPMMKLAELIRSEGFHVTFVLTEFNERRLLRSQGAAALAGKPDLRFHSIPDGLPPSDLNATQDVRALCSSILDNFLLGPFIELIGRLSSPAAGVPRVTRIVSDGMMSFCFDAGKKVGVPVTAFWSASACGLMGYLHFDELLRRGVVPLKDQNHISNGYLETAVNWIPGMRNVRLKDLPSFIRTTDQDEILFKYLAGSARRIAEADAIIVNTFDDLERPILLALSSLLPPPIHAIGPIHLLTPRETPIGGNLWKGDATCIEWLNGRSTRSVVYVNFGSITVMSSKHLVEFAWGLAESGHEFLWVIRGDLVEGEKAMLPAEFLEETKIRGKMTDWCEQEEVLMHPAVGVFLTHAGWNSMLESFSFGVPVICWPFFAEQTTNCRYASEEWGVGVEINNDVKRGEVKRLIREVMTGEKGRGMREKMAGWKEAAHSAVANRGPSFVNFKRVVNDVLAG